MRWRFTLNPDTDNKVISEPIGWSDISFKLVRDKEWHGIFFEYSLPLEFYDDPKDVNKNAFSFLKAEYEANGVEGFCILKVEEKCDGEDTYTTEGQWRMNFTSYERSYDNGLCLIKLNLEPENVLMTFRNRYDQKVELIANETFDGTAMDDYTTMLINTPISFPPKAVPVITQMAIDNGLPTDALHVEYVEVDVIPSGSGSSTEQMLRYFQVNFARIGFDEVTNRLEIETNNFASEDDIQGLFSIAIDGEYTIEIPDMNINVSVSAVADRDTTSACANLTYEDISVDLYLEIAGGTPINLGSSTDSGCLDASDVQSINVLAYNSGEVSLSAGDTIRMWLRVEANGEWDRNLLSDGELTWTVTVNYFEADSNEYNFILSGNTFYTASNIRVSFINETANRVLESITDKGLKFLSSYYGRTDSEPYVSPDSTDGCGSLRCVALGIHIRNYAALHHNLSFKEIYEALNAIDNIGIGLEDYLDGYTTQRVIRMEPMEYFYDDTVILQLDKIPKVRITVLQDEHYSIFKFGYEKWEAEEFSGLDEFNTQREYRTTLTSVNNTLTKVCNWIASGYAIEITRRKSWLSVTNEDWRFDNDTFIICLKRNESSGFAVEQGNISGAANLVDPDSVYNYRISPVRNALRWLKRVLASYRDATAAESTLEFTDGQANVLAEGLMTGGCLVEEAAVAENDTLQEDLMSDPAGGIPVYRPELWEFEYPLSFSDYQALKASPTGTVQCRFGQDADYLDFYIREIDYKPNNGLATFLLLPKALYPLDECSLYVIQMRGAGTTQFGSSILIGADLENLFVFVNGDLMKYNDAVTANNEIVSWNSATGYGVLQAPIGEGMQITIIHFPPELPECSTCISRFEGRGDGTTTPAITGIGSSTLNTMLVFYNGRLQKYSDLVAANNQITAYNSGTEELTFNAPTNANRELRVLSFNQGCCMSPINTHGDGDATAVLTGMGVTSLADMLVFYNGNLMKYNDSEIANNQILSYNAGTQTLTATAPMHPSRELRALKLQNC